MTNSPSIETLRSVDSQGIFWVDPTFAANFREVADALMGEGFRVARIAGAADKRQLLELLARALSFPDYFGKNWDALHECLCDMSWDRATGYLLFFENLEEFGSSRPGDLGILLDIIPFLKESGRGDSMNLKILQDGDRRPDLYLWNGPVPDGQFEEWLATRGLEIPADLRLFLVATGGGDFLESETVLGPFGDASLGDDLDGFNDFQRGKGMPGSLLVFHRGIFWTAVNLEDQTYVELDSDSFARVRRFESLNQWYQAIRDELGARYGL